MESTKTQFLTPTLRYPCCEHCLDEGCPKLVGHSLPCGVKGCESDVPITEQSTEGDPATEDIVEYLGEMHLVKMKDDLIDSITQLVGYEPPGIRALLRVMGHPSLVGDVRDYFDSIDTVARCLNYAPPWNCAKEAEAQYQNIKYGWLGGAAVGGYDEWWCDNCRKRVMGSE